MGGWRDERERQDVLHALNHKRVLEIDPFVGGVRAITASMEGMAATAGMNHD